MLIADPVKTYTFNEHKHCYAVWTAARAQRAFAKNEEIAKAICTTSLRSFLEEDVCISHQHFDAKHVEWCEAIIHFFGDDKCKYGRAAKIVAIYLKTALILPAQGN